MPDDYSRYSKVSESDQESLPFADLAECSDPVPSGAGVETISASEKKRVPPYEVYLRHRRAAFVAKIIVLGVIVVFFAVWLFILLRKGGNQ